MRGRVFRVGDHGGEMAHGFIHQLGFDSVRHIHFRTIFGTTISQAASSPEGRRGGGSTTWSACEGAATTGGTTTTAAGIVSVISTGCGKASSVSQVTAKRNSLGCSELPPTGFSSLGRGNGTTFGFTMTEHRHLVRRSLGY